MKSSGCGLSDFWKLFDACRDGHRPTKDKSHIDRRVVQFCVQLNVLICQRERGISGVGEEDSRRSGGFTNATKDNMG